MLNDDCTSGRQCTRPTTEPYRINEKWAKQQQQQKKEKKQTNFQWKPQLSSPNSTFRQLKFIVYENENERRRKKNETVVRDERNGKQEEEEERTGGGERGREKSFYYQNDKIKLFELKWRGEVARRASTKWNDDDEWENSQTNFAQNYAKWHDEMAYAPKTKKIEGERTKKIPDRLIWSVCCVASSTPIELEKKYERIAAW